MNQDHPDEKEKRTTLRISEHKLTVLKHLAIDRGVTQNDLIIAAIDQVYGAFMHTELNQDSVGVT